MTSYQPFEANITSSVAGKTISLVIPATPFAISVTASTPIGPSVLVANVGANMSWVRMSVETSTVATGIVSTTDTPITSNTVRLFANPSPGGKVALAVIATISGNTVFFTFGEGGIA